MHVELPWNTASRGARRLLRHCQQTVTIGWRAYPVELSHSWTTPAHASHCLNRLSAALGLAAGHGATPSWNLLVPVVIPAPGQNLEESQEVWPPSDDVVFLVLVDDPGAWGTGSNSHHVPSVLALCPWQSLSFVGYSRATAGMRTERPRSHSAA